MKKEKINEIIFYLVGGILTTLVSLGIYYGLVYTIVNPNDAIQLQITNIISWLGAVIFAYLTNNVFVFKSTNQNKKKETFQFFSSRLATLLMDMFIMFMGVTILHFSDKIIKLVSQVVITIANYILSKFLVFSSKKNIKKEKIPKEINIKYLIFMLLTINVLSFYFPNDLFIIIKFSITLFFYVYIWIKIIKEKEYVLIPVLSLFFIITSSTYQFILGSNFFNSCTSSLNISLIIILLLDSKKLNLNRSFFTIFYILTIIFYMTSKDILAFMLLGLPFIYEDIKTHHNILIKIIYTLILMTFIVLNSSYLILAEVLLIILYDIYKNKDELMKKRKYYILLAILFTILTIISLNNNKKVLELENFNSIKQTFINSKIEVQIFGIKGFKDSLNMGNFILSYGAFGASIYILTLISIIILNRKNKRILFYILLFVISSVIFDNTMSSSETIILLFIISNQIVMQKQKSVLIISNMYPSKKYKHYGIFVKNMEEDIKKLNYKVDHVVKKKVNNRLFKIISYLVFYVKGFTISFINSYDFFYVHFISHSTLPVILSKKVSPSTKLILNAHGNDVVLDCKQDKKNIIRSKKYLKYADLIVVPSSYFKSIIHQDYKVAEKLIKIYPSAGIDEKVFYQRNKKMVKSKLGLDLNTSYIGYVSRIEKDKGWDDLIDAIKEFEDNKLIENTKVIIIGTGDEQKKLDAKIKDYHLENKIIQKNFVSQKELADYYNAFDLIIFPTKRKSESLGLVGLEAMASKTPLIVCNKYGPKEYANEDNAFTYQNERDLIETINKYLKSSPSYIRSKIDNGYETSKKYRITSLKESLKDIFK